jgi:hypothetical protein
MVRILSSLLAGFLVLTAQAQTAQYPYETEPEKQVHWATAAFFGTGWYQVDQNRTMYIFRIPPRQRVREAGWYDDGRRRPGIEIQYPLALGLHKLDEIPDFIEFENYGTITFTPGVRVEIPIDERWSLRPYGHLGLGYERQSGEWARIWYGGMKSRYLLAESERFRWSLLNSIDYAGFKPEYEDRGRYGSVMAGLEFNHPLKRFSFGGDPVWLNWHFTYSYLFDNLQFHMDEEQVATVRDQWEIGLAFSNANQRVNIWFMTFEQIGLSFQTSSNGAYEAITVNFRSPFTY